jgi:hypothetical protein
VNIGGAVSVGSVSITLSSLGSGTAYFYRLGGSNTVSRTHDPNESSFSTSGTGTGNLIAWWKFDNDTNDSSGNALHGTGTDHAFDDGYFGQALSCDGVSTIVNFGAPALLDNLRPISITAWIKPTGWGENTKGRIASKLGGNGAYAFTLFQDQQGLYFSKHFDSTYLFSDQSYGAYTTLGTWTHVALTWTGEPNYDSVKFYLNGSLTAYGTNTDNGAGEIVSDVGTNFYVGNEPGTTQTFNGLIDDMRIYSAVLSADQILALAQEVQGGGASAIGDASMFNSYDMIAPTRFIKYLKDNNIYQSFYKHIRSSADHENLFRNPNGVLSALPRD